VTVGDVVGLADLVLALGGRYSIEMGIDVDRDDEEVERWFLAATLFGHRISARTVVRTYAALSQARILAIADVAGSSWEVLVERLDEGGYVRYDFSTATRLQALATAVNDRLGGRIAGLEAISAEAGLDVRDAEAALIRLELAHARRGRTCPGGTACLALRR
jgi:hypothetical protein